MTASRTGDGWPVLDECFEPDIEFVAGSRVVPPKEGRWFSTCPTVEPADVVYDPRVMNEAPPGFDLLGANIAVRRAGISRVGGFDESMGPGSVFQGGEEHDYVYRLSQVGVKRMRSTPKSTVHHTHGRRHGLRAMYRLKRQRIRGDSVVAPKGTLGAHPTGGDRVRDCVIELGRAQLKIIVARKRPWRLLRVFYFLRGYRECLRGFVLTCPISTTWCRPC